MMLSRELLVRFLIICLPFLGLGCLWFYDNSGLVQVTVLGALAVFVALLGLTFRQVMSRKWLIWLTVGTFSIMSTLAYHKGLGSGIMLINLLLAACIFNNIIVSQNTYRWIHLAAGGMLLFFLFTVNYHMTSGGAVLSRFGASPINKNGIGILWFACAAHWLCYFRAFFGNKLAGRLVNVLVVAVSGYFILWSTCRSALLALLCFAALIFIKEEPFSMPVYKGLARTGLISSLGFVFVYLGLASYLETIRFLGKGFATRQMVWRGSVDLIGQYPWLGSANDFSFDILGAAGESSHNMLIGIWKMFGIIPVLLVIFLLVNNHTYKPGVKVAKAAQFALLSSLWIAFFESFLTASQIYLFFLLFLICQVKPYGHEPSR